MYIYMYTHLMQTHIHMHINYGNLNSLLFVVFFFIGGCCLLLLHSFPPPFITGDQSIQWLMKAAVKAWSSWLTADALTDILRYCHASARHDMEHATCMSLWPSMHATTQHRCLYGLVRLACMQAPKLL